ncbi:Arf guanyl-nucleotide exchange factor [Heterostelium album PN500]|uniref:Arf guanyl-nucleotide exchange factor n=1 Tax=Heterostelium pallidum (strain ATCC 26659 / Pp 5 / PN500) TaxID=670386 RepID=D3B5W1_HETP5|nr:Arf guanyl-nucleotide exchange factor [Heterostelium album PN500]EFA83259.1 Arf guanyl-nucleotide exchange factor [Heterostelium album PN500]|eukprot:XP_020435376.1 Arf guanyl-nucleotide exchange factor [Heterostelium album PN500]
MDESIALLFNNAIQKIFSQSSRKNLVLREACKSAQDAIRDSPIFTSSIEQKNHIPDSEWEILGNKLVNPMKLACETREPKIMIAAIDSLDKLIAYGIVKPSSYEEVPPQFTGEKKKLIEKIVDTIGQYYSYLDDSVQLQIIRALLTAVISPHSEVHDSCLMSAIRACYNIYLISDSLNHNQPKSTNTITAKNTLFQMVDFVLSRFESSSQQKILLPKHSSSLPISSSSSSNNNNNGNSNSSQSNGSNNSNSNKDNIKYTEEERAHKEAFCKLSTKEIPDNAKADSQEVRSKILSLELLARILENPLPSLKLSEKFINTSIKRNLSVTLLSNGASDNLPEFKLTLSMFSSLIIHFKEHLKEEIGTYFSRIILHTLASSSSVRKKWLVLPTLYEICKNPQTIVDIFVNYDCDPERKDIFEKMVYELSRVAQGANISGSGASGGISANDRSSAQIQQEEAKCKKLGLECIVTIMNSLVDWSKEIYESKRIEQQTRANATLMANNNSSSNDDEPDTSDTLINGNISPLKSSIDETQRNILLEQGKQKFSSHPKKGIEFLTQCGLLKETPTDIAEFLRQSDFDQKKIGEYLCSHIHSFPNKLLYVLYKFIDTFDFKNIDIDQALKSLLTCIQLNGENQAIDRVVEKFAEKYFNDNPESIYSNAESVYLLSYGIIILSTDLHNSSIKSKLTKEEWLKMNSKSNNKNDYKEDFLVGIYDRVSQESYKLGCNTNEDAEFLDTQERLLRFNRDSDYIVKQCQELMKTRISKKTTFYRARNIEHVRPMFLLSWCYVLSTLSVILDDTKEKKLISLCLDGFSAAIRVSSTTDGNYLQDSWTPILKTICILERLHLIDTSKTTLSPSATSPSAFPSVVEFSQNSLQNQIKKLLEENPKDLIFDSIQVERIFTNTVYLSDDSIVTFVRCLCEVSEEEISHYSRSYSLIKLVEVIEYNLKRRIRLVFYNIWEIAVSHFTKIGSHQNIEIALHAIDSLRQLASKYMEKEEMSHFNFQNEFLMPFETIMLNNQVPQIRELIIRCISHLVLSKAQNIKSGWQTILNVLTIGSRVSYEPIVVLAFQSVEQILTHCFGCIEDNFFVDTVNCLTSFSNPQVLFPDISIRSLQQLDMLTKKILPPPQPAATTVNNESEKTNNNINHNHQHFSQKIESQLLPIIQGFATPITHENESVRSLSSNLLFKLLNQYGSQFTDATWSYVINSILLKVFKSVIDLQKQTPFTDFEYMWVRQTCPSILIETINLLSGQHVQLCKFYSTFMNLLEKFICNSNQPISILGCEYLCKFIQKCAVYFTEEHWSLTSDTIGRVIKHLVVKDPTASQFCSQIVKYWSFVYCLTKFNSSTDSNGVQVPSLNETNSLSCLLNFLFHMFLNESYPDRQQEIQLFLNSLCADILKDVSQQIKPPANMVSIVRQITDGFNEYNYENQFKKHIPMLYPHLIDLTIIENYDIRMCILSIFNRFGKDIPSITEIQEPTPLPLEPISAIKAKPEEPVVQLNPVSEAVVEQNHEQSTQKEENEVEQPAQPKEEPEQQVVDATPIEATEDLNEEELNHNHAEEDMTKLIEMKEEIIDEPIDQVVVKESIEIENGEQDPIEMTTENNETQNQNNEENVESEDIL